MTTTPAPSQQFGSVSAHTFVGHDLILDIDTSFTAQELQDLLERMLPHLRQGEVTAADGVLRLGQGEMTVSSAQVEALGKYIATLGAADAAQREEAYLAFLCIDKTYRRWLTQYAPLSGGYRPAQPGDLPELSPSYRKLDVIGDGPQRRIERVPLPDILTAVNDHTTFILLAPPGAGKTTVLQRLVLDMAMAHMAEQPGARLPLYAPLAAQQPNETPHTFLARMWQEQIPGLHSDAVGEFSLALNMGRLCLLCDAMNEAKRENLTARLNDWRRFARTLPAGNRLVFSCRTLDYENELDVQRVEIDPLSPEQIQDFARRYLGPERGADLWQTLQADGETLLPLARIPFYLLMMVREFEAEDRLPDRRAVLFRNFAHRLFAREADKGHADWIDPAAQRLALADLAFAMQEVGVGTTVDREWALNALPAQVDLPDGPTVPTPPKTVLRLAHAASLIADTFQAQVKFGHHLLQEYFAADEMHRRLAQGEDLAHLWRVASSQREMPPDEPTDRWDPLPPPPTTHWEQTTILAAGLNPAIVERVRTVNPALAARCLLDLGEETDPAQLETSRQDLLARLGNISVHLRSRIEAGLLLGRLKDPRFPVETVNGVQVILPPEVEIPTATATIGTGIAGLLRWRQGDESPRHTVGLAAYALGRYPVTNAEYACFMAAKGYENPDYWTDGGKYWLRGEPVPGEDDPADYYLRWWKQFKEDPAKIDQNIKQGAMTEREADKLWRILITWDEDRVIEQVREWFPQGEIYRQPRYWDDDEFNNPSQPVVGICWYEAVAYANWLADVTGLPYRLPTEPEWEWAARRGRRTYPWGNRWRPDRLNYLDSRVMRTTPVGTYPHGATPDGIHDMAGNVWEWTASRYAKYPYRAEAKLEDPDATGLRIGRGGGWGANQLMVRCAFRRRSNPWGRDGYWGYRLARLLSQ